MKWKNDKLNALENDARFQSIRDKYEEPNLFAVMGKTHLELWHTSFYAWLLDPHSNHGLKTRPLRLLLNYVNDTYNKQFITDEDKLSSMFFVENQSDKTGSSRGKKNMPDIVGKSDSLYLIIENKVEAEESVSEDGQTYQTDRYYKEFEEKYSQNTDLQRCYLFLTAKNRNAKNKEFKRITYQDFYDNVISPLLLSENIKSATSTVLKQYVDAISNPNRGYFKHSSRYILSIGTIAREMFNDHSDTFESIRKKVMQVESDQQSSGDSSKAEQEEVSFFRQYWPYLNVILKGADQEEITYNSSAYNTKDSALKKLIDGGFIGFEEGADVSTTELIIEKGPRGNQNKAIYVIQIIRKDGLYKCIGGYTYNLNYYGEEGVSALVDEDGEFLLFDSINAVSKAIQLAHYKEINADAGTNPGPAAGTWKLINSPNKEYKEGEELGKYINR